MSIFQPIWTMFKIWHFLKIYIYTQCLQQNWQPVVRVFLCSTIPKLTLLLKNTFERLPLQLVFLYSESTFRKLLSLLIDGDFASLFLVRVKGSAAQCVERRDGRRAGRLWERLERREEALTGGEQPCLIRNKPHSPGWAAHTDQRHDTAPALRWETQPWCV